MSEMKLTYFDARGRAEMIRMLFKLAGKSFVDNRVGGEDWQKFKPTTPKGQLPVLEVNGKMLCESMAITRFVARETGLYGSNNWEAAVCDMLADSVNDVFTGYIAKMQAKTDDARAEAQKKCDSLLEALDKFALSLKKGDFVLGDKPSLADVLIFAVTPENCKSYPTLEVLAKSFAAIPNIAEWLKNRPKTTM